MILKLYKLTLLLSNKLSLNSSFHVRPKFLYKFISRKHNQKKLYKIIIILSKHMTK